MAVGIEMIQMKWFLSFVKCRVQMVDWLIESSWHCFKFKTEMENVKFKVNLTANV